ncbi:hypothetical protein SYNTR_1937 [Candidatus Syntrophocurvum alkaliphilum]|uniref:Spore germination protein GerKB n=1 Tax=Candidatus Syntrophocurvum alkaliphilum TaxID=2293317 RepID=A0A6I6DMW1_9FIRM|nr:endospore germination permease [Candidatus Syntrophocurvum alkaliphilum]QGU00531.1 hypothetical protein SYNTR_1937 [Candidatus Syntrophocurvum alkaliphilum]
MTKISNFQLYCMLVLLSLPISFLVVPKQLALIIGHSGWLAVIASFFGALILIYAFVFILRKSTRPFPLMLEDHLGMVIGKILSIIYIFIFLLCTIINLRTFLDFVASVVLPLVPISVYIGLMVFVSFYAIKTGLEAFSRISEIIVMLGIPATLLILFLSINEGVDFGGLLPVFYIDPIDFAHGTYISIMCFSSLFAVLTLGFFSEAREKISSVLVWVLITHVVIITLTTAILLMLLGPFTTGVLTFPTFSLVRHITVAGFIQGVDFIFIAIWIAGISGAITIQWFVFCYIIQQTFRLKDYRFIAAPSSLIIGFYTVMLTPNIVELIMIRQYVLPVVAGIFFIGFPLLFALGLMFKGDPDPSVGTGLRNDPNEVQNTENHEVVNS